MGRSDAVQLGPDRVETAGNGHGHGYLDGGRRLPSEARNVHAPVR